ncbi:MAG: beta-ketoacyl-ACP reductase [Deltaproteobacteria bacterium RIFOXYD12_FULL_57_12]|nr:MAG: beta-ketoacyl-ACP reductase [Deltaproteobacteria bacterium RIFOXYD12_FULL_57_12]
MAAFQNSKVIVTGATRGIGRAIATAFLEAGATVLGIYTANEETAAAFRDECHTHTDRLQLYRLDISSESEVAAFYQQVEERFDTVDILVNNAGIRRDAVLAMMPAADWQRVLDINLTGTFLMSKQAVLLMMKQKYGRIIHITSPMAHLGFAGQANYAASKAGQIGMMRSLAKETAKRNITINCVSPGFIATELLDGLPPAQLDEYRRLVPLKRFGTPAEVATAVLFLAGREASYITGSVLEVTGGL